MSAAAACQRTADTFYAAFFLFVNISYCCCSDNQKNCYSDNICHSHNDHPLCHITSQIARLSDSLIACVQVVFSLQASVCFLDQVNDVCHDRDHNDETWNEAITKAAGSDQRADLVYEERDSPASRELQADSANSHFLLLISEFIAPIAAKQGGVYRLNIR